MGGCRIPPSPPPVFCRAPAGLPCAPPRRTLTAGACVPRYLWSLTVAPLLLASSAVSGS